MKVKEFDEHQRRGNEVVGVNEFDEYQRRVVKYDVGENQKIREEVGTGVGPQRLLDAEFIDKVLGLAGEAGETADKFKKIIRDKGGEISEEDRGELVKELGDTLWYVATVARYLDVKLSEVAEGNVEKLEKRYARGKLSGEGDNR